MKKRTAFLIYGSFILILVIIFPMRGIVSLVDDKDKMKINSIEGFWWKGSFEGVALLPIYLLRSHANSRCANSR